MPDVNRMKKNWELDRKVT